MIKRPNWAQCLFLYNLWVRNGFYRFKWLKQTPSINAKNRPCFHLYFMEKRFHDMKIILCLNFSPLWCYTGTGTPTCSHMWIPVSQTSDVCVVAVETAWPEPMTYTICPFSEKVCQFSVYELIYYIQCYYKRSVIFDIHIFDIHMLQWGCIKVYYFKSLMKTWEKPKHLLISRWLNET